MRYYTLKQQDRTFVAVSEDGAALYELSGYADMNAVIDAGGVKSIPADAVPVTGDFQILSPIPQPRQDVLCLGINYAAHAAEAEKFSKAAFGGDRPYPIFFAKRVSWSQGTGEPIPSYPGLVDSLDYECELGVVIGKTAKNVAREDAASVIFGYTIVNDVSARNLQTRHKQWYFGKSLDGFTPMGPCIVSADSFAFPPAQRITCSVNGELRQNSTTDILITGIPDIIAVLTEGMTLLPGTIIATGTPAGVGMGMNPPTFLRHGDVVRCEIDGIGVLENPID